MCTHKQQQQQRSGNKKRCMKVIISIIVLVVSIAVLIGLGIMFHNKKEIEIKSPPEPKQTAAPPFKRSHFNPQPAHQSPQRSSNHSKFTKHVTAYREYHDNVHPSFKGNDLEFFEIRGNNQELPDNLIEHLRQYPVIDDYGKTLNYPKGILQDFETPTIFFHGTNKIDPWDFDPKQHKQLWLISLTQQNQRNFYWPLAGHCAGDKGWIIIFQLIEEEKVKMEEFNHRLVPDNLLQSETIIGRTGYTFGYEPSQHERQNGFNRWVHPDAYICTEACMKSKRAKWKILRAYQRFPGLPLYRRIWRWMMD